MTTTWQLVGITSGEATCDHCGRTLARCFRVVTPDGAEMTVGRVCSAKLTGYNWKLAQAERAD
jgi:ribosome-binding protein aMBF1 (putative translation factor)